jgi:predicted nucleic acid-binding Zn ribbon protein
MPTYIYETVPAEAGATPEQFEHWQSMKEEPLTRHPVSGVAVRRVITGGFAPMGVKAPAPTASAGGGSCGSGCGCH